ncbi:hypothetical protein CSUI_004354 [Cystoisospora suis]|uniref:Transmembrane protein n=1 Tax=Cystoisospora suis TaxID=483139 RepID=A0A2C6L1A3_9APIC|nr:hypothetical protein CSUI_004354 [Cystoisospora suis]
MPVKDVSHLSIYLSLIYLSLISLHLSIFNLSSSIYLYLSICVETDIFSGSLVFFFLFLSHLHYLLLVLFLLFLSLFRILPMSSFLEPHAQSLCVFNRSLQCIVLFSFFFLPPFPLLFFSPFSSGVGGVMRMRAFRSILVFSSQPLL